MPRTKERQKRRGERSGLSAFNHTSPSQNPHLRHRCRRAEMERRGEEREEWGGREDEEEQQGKSLSLPNLTRSLMYSRGKS